MAVTVKQQGTVQSAERSTTICMDVAYCHLCFFFFFQAEDGIRDLTVTGVQTCALPISRRAFLEAGLALPAVLHSAPEPGGWRSSGPAFSQDSSFDPWVEIHAENLRHNEIGRASCRERV